MSQHNKTTYSAGSPAAIASSYPAAAVAAADKLAIRERASLSGRSVTSTTATVTGRHHSSGSGRNSKRATAKELEMSQRGRSAVASVAFLLRMADNFALEGNLPESVKSAETALLFRKAGADAVQQVIDQYNRHHRPDTSAECDEDDDEAILPATMDLQGKNLVLQCNSYAVAEFSHRRFDTATFFLNKALFLTEASGSAEDYPRSYTDREMVAGTDMNAMTDDEDDVEEFLSRIKQKLDRDGRPQSTKTEADLRAALGTSAHGQTGSFCFSTAAEEDRLRLRAATFNNIGCMERRRGRLDEALGFLRKAIQIESQLGTAEATASPSTYLNLCTVLNELHLHREAVAAAQNAIAALQQQLVEQVSLSDKARVAVMLMVGQYNLGVSLERRGEKRDAEAAQKAYQQSLNTSRRYQLVSGDCPTIEAAVAAVKRMKGELLTGVAQTRDTPEPPRERTQQSEQRHDSADVVHKPQPWENVDAQAQPWAVPVEPLLGFQSSATQQQQQVFLLRDTNKAGANAQSGGKNARLTSTAPPGLLTTADIFTSTDDGERHGSPVLNPEQLVTSTSATWHPTHAKPTSSAAPLNAPPASHVGVAASAENDSNKSQSARLTPFQAALTPFDRQQQVQQQERRLSLGQSTASSHNAHSLLRPPRAPQQNAKPQAPPTLAPLFAPSSTGSRNSNSVRNLVVPPMPPALPHPGSPAGSMDRQSIPSLTNHKSASILPTQARDSITSAPSVRNPFGRRMFGSTAMHQQQFMPSPPSGSASKGASAVVGGAGTIGGRLGSLLSAAGGASGVLSSQQQRIVKEQKELTRAKRLQERQRRVNKRRQDREMAEYDAALGDAAYEQMVAGMEHEELSRCHEAAVAIQRIWRGVAARAWIRTMIAAASTLQRVTRVFLVRVREEHRLAELERQRLLAEQQARQLAACRVIQGRVRQFIRRLQIRREYVARQRRFYYAARTIQRGYRNYLKRKQAMLAALAEAHRREDEQRAFRRKVAANRIQRAFHQFQDRKAELAAAEEQQRRSRAVTKIQSVVRGVLTRAWFRYYRAYRHDQAMRSAASQRKITIIQTYCRAIQSVQHCLKRKHELLKQIRQRRLALAATKIQGMWRQHVARVHLERLRADRARLDRRATVIQRWYHMRVERRAFLAYREAKRQRKAATLVQRWVRAQWMRHKEEEFARYHAEKLREQQLNRLREWAKPVLLACIIAKQSELLVSSMRRGYEKNATVARLWQRVARGYAARKGVALDKDIALRVARGERELACRAVAAHVIQRAWRVAMAKSEVDHRRRERLAALIISRSYRCYRARAELHELRMAYRQKREEQAARTIQLGFRNYREKERAREMKDYYGTAHKKKMWLLRRAEAAVMIQSLWRGHVTRLAMERVLQERQRRTHAATSIQRAWRDIAQRQSLRATVTQRVSQRQQKEEAAITIQCFWRKMAAAERVVAVREENRVRAARAVVIQCWWRSILAKRELALRRRVVAEEEALAVYYAAKWERAASIINAFLRSRQCCLANLQSLHDTLFSRLRLHEQVRFRKRSAAAVKIQALYRGFYQRCCYRGLLLEKRERDKVAAERAVLESRAALCIQCCYRRHHARNELLRRRIAQREGALAEQEEALIAMDSQQLVRELFWVRNLVNRRDATAERVARARQHHDAAVAIQRAYRCYAARQLAAQAAREAQAVRAASTIASYYCKHRAATAVRDAHRKEAIAVYLQARVRGWLVRRRWAAWRADLAEERRLKKEVEDMLDAAATTIQSAWRRLLAQREVRARRQRRAMEKEIQRQQEAASLIQNAFKTYKEEGHAPRIEGTGAVYRTY